MPFIKELVIHGFKSFARETKIPFKGEMNVIIGANGSGKSNVTDAICFVLGRMGSKSMRAKRLSNLIFAGTHQYKPASEASVEIIFDNNDKGFSLDQPDVSIKRILRRNGQGIYKINNEVKTRQDVLELLSQANIDPNGFNIVLQGEIDSFVKMSPDERRGVIEEVAGISVYEMRKKNSLSELEKTENKLKEVSAILRERNVYLKNLEEERKNALKFKKLQEELKSCKASVCNNNLKEKEEKIEEINKNVEKEQGAIGKINQFLERNSQEIAILNEKISNISLNIQKSSGLEQDRINAEISDLRAELVGLETQGKNYENRINEMKMRKDEVDGKIRDSEAEIIGIKKSNGKSVGKDLVEKKKELETIDEQKRNLHILKSKLSSLNAKIEDKQIQVQRIKIDSDGIFSRIKQLESELKTKEGIEEQKEKTAVARTNLDKLKKDFDDLIKERNDNEKIIAISEKQIEDIEKIKGKVSSLDICPLCKTKITKEHVHHVIGEQEKEKLEYQTKGENSQKAIKEINEKLRNINEVIRRIEEELRIRSQDILKLELINEKKNDLRKSSEDLKNLEGEYSELINKKASLEKQISLIRTSEENYDMLRVEIQELERHEEKNTDLAIIMKQRELERMKISLKEITREIEENSSELKEINGKIDEKQSIFEEKSKQDISLKEKFKRILEEKNKYSEKIRFFENDSMRKQNDKQLIEERMNNMKIDRARFMAEKSAVEDEAREFAGAQIIRNNTESLRKKIEEIQLILATIGSVNLRAIEIYEEIKREYEKVQEKANKILEEKEEIMKVIEDIDKKKKKAFFITLEKINELFSRNFSQLSSKGTATLEPTNKEDIFAGGIEMLIKVGKGKYFDTHSLSGGEQSLISLSLIFAIQEYRPYCFYIFDEIDAALDRHNSERLATLLKRYMNRGQYLIITHNDSLITEAPVIYGVSMQDKISRVLSMEV
jgi:chromosome segregation protein